MFRNNGVREGVCIDFRMWGGVSFCGIRSVLRLGGKGVVIVLGWVVFGGRSLGDLIVISEERLNILFGSLCTENEVNLRYLVVEFFFK